ncbi:MAG: L,D-transpeptidase family protein [Chloroflexi bacterium]|nr:L,D-transpeptidase family protein [Chloroflexota bacterium]
MRFLTTLGLVLVLSAGMLSTLPTKAEAASSWTGVVTTSGLNVRPAPNTSQPPVGKLNHGDRVNVVAEVQGESVLGDTTWYQIGPGRFVFGAYVSRVNSDPDLETGERWIDVNLSRKIARAMVGQRAVYTAEVTIGREGWNTPVGRFSIVRRVENETMDSATIGIPRNSPDGYYLTGVLYTQYFLWSGQALHYNYWVPDEAFGNWASSRGCVGLRLADARFFWDFAEIGTPVVIHF